MLIYSQVLVAIVAVLVRFAADGVWFIVMFLSLGGLALAVLSPLMVTVMTVAFFAPGLRARTVLMLGIADIALLIFALTVPDRSDINNDHLVPLAAFTTGDAAVTSGTAGTFSFIGGIAALVYVVAAAATIVVVVLDQLRARRAFALHDLAPMTVA